MRVYIAGPMRGYPDFNYATFNDLADCLRRYGLRGREVEVANPAENFGGDQGRDFSEYMAVDMRQLLDCQAIVLLPGWQDSEGARLEASVATAIGLELNEASRTPGGGWCVVRKVGLTELDEGIEQEARRLVYGERSKTYGHPRGDFDRVAGMWSALTGADINAEMVAIMMVAFKLARLSKSPEHRDSKVDTIGYVLCLDRLQDGGQ